VSSTLGVNCGVSTGRNGVIQRGRQLDAVAFHLTQDPITSEEKTPCLSAGSSTHGQASVGVALSFEPWAARRLGGYVWEEVAGTLRAEAGDNRLSTCYVLDDQGGSQITVRTDGKVPTLRAEAHGNLPCVMSPVCYNGLIICLDCCTQFGFVQSNGRRSFKGRLC
jgi:DNA (cytosine-5)-methyltransferase 1